MQKPLALTIGEPAGIGPDITIAAWQRRVENQLPPFYLLGNAELIRRRAHSLGVDIVVAEVEPRDAADTFARALPVVNIGEALTAKPGQPDASSAPV
ncbi:MAG: 4-hydroxythreonine-4-phosphate dehydrogenase, partial [Rhizobiales bacterium]|nr:4-hydroxythreonine-4-phosphate dehydrogenase [Hyphomicrobiales bacterium]